MDGVLLLPLPYISRKCRHRSTTLIMPLALRRAPSIQCTRNSVDCDIQPVAWNSRLCLHRNQSGFFVDARRCPLQVMLMSVPGFISPVESIKCSGDHSCVVVLMMPDWCIAGLLAHTALCSQSRQYLLEGRMHGCLSLKSVLLRQLSMGNRDALFAVRYGTSRRRQLLSTLRPSSARGCESRS